MKAGSFIFVLICPPAKSLLRYFYPKTKTKQSNIRPRGAGHRPLRRELRSFDHGGSAKKSERIGSRLDRNIPNCESACRENNGPRQIFLRTGEKNKKMSR